MAIPFNPPEWLLQEYVNRKSTGQQVLDSANQAASTYVGYKQNQEAKKQADFANYLKLLETDPELAKTPMGLEIQNRVGPGLGNYQPPSVSSPTTPSPAGPTAGTTPASGGSPFIRAIPNIEALQGRGKLGEKAIGQVKTGQEMQKTGLDIAKLERDLNTDPNAPVPTMTKAEALALGSVPKNVMIIEPTKPDKPPQSGAQKSVDREFGKEYARYVSGGGYADVVGQIQSLEGVLGELEGGKKNLTGPVISAQPDWSRSRLNPESMSSQQTVEQSVQRSLKQTLGGQFTEKEGMLFMKRGYDPVLPEAENASKLKRMVGQLKTMAMAKQQAIDYYEENGSLDGYRGDLYTLQNGEMVRTTKDDFYRMMGAETGGSQTPPHQTGGGFDPAKKSRLEELRAKRAAGTLR